MPEISRFYGIIIESSIFQRFWAVAGAASIRIKVLGIVLGVVLLLGVFVILQMNTLLTNQLWDDLVQQGIASSAQIERTVDNVLRRLITIVLVMVGIGFAAAVLLIGILTRPILELVEATNALGRGEFHTRVERWADDEIGELASAFNAMAASLQEAEAARAQQEALRRGYVSGVILAQENERQRIARELHDSTSQALTFLLVGLQNLKVAEDKETLNHYIDELRAGVGQTLDEVRTLAWRLRPNSLDDLGLVSALQQAIHDFQNRYAIQVDYAVSGMETRVAPELETTIYRIVQEGLTNIARYAQADAASVLISRRQDLIRIVVEDDGVGFDPQIVQQTGRSLGLQGIRERAQLFNGKMTIESQPGQGTSLFVEIPYPDAQQEVSMSSIDQTSIELFDADFRETGSTFA